MSRIYRRNEPAPGRAIRYFKAYRQTLPLLASLLCLLIAMSGRAQAAPDRQLINGQVCGSFHRLLYFRIDKPQASACLILAFAHGSTALKVNMNSGIEEIKSRGLYKQ